MKIVIWPENLSDTSKNNKNVIKTIKLKHPVTETECLFFYDENEFKIYELTQFSEPHRSWFLGNKAYSDGSILLTTPLDPIFLLIPYLEKNGKRFSILEDILQDEEFPDNKFLISVLNKIKVNVQTITDFKDFSNNKVFRFNEDKTVDWLKVKVTSLSKVLEEKSIDINVGGSCASNYVETKEISKESYLEYSCNLLGEYISQALLHKLKSSYGFSITDSDTSVSKKRGLGDQNESTNLSPKSKKGKVGVEPDDDYSAGANGNNSTNSKSNQKLTVSQKRLLKVDKTGMKNLSHFFAKK